MSTKTKTLAKSLHTVTALAAMAKALRRDTDELSSAEAMQCALAALGYLGAADPYGLAAKALAAMEG